MGRKAIPVRRRACAHCGMVMERKRYRGRLEDRGVYTRRRYCDQRCMGLARTSESPGLSALHKRAARFRGTNCETCSTVEMLGVHHIDHDPSNNERSNLMTLCASCHTTWHWKNGKRWSPGHTEAQTRKPGSRG